MSWQSSIEYERIINQEIRRRLGGTHSAELLIRSYDFARIERLQVNDEWDSAGLLLGEDARKLQDAGADCVVLCTNTMHRVADEIEGALTVPFLHLADAVGKAVTASGLQAVGLLGTRFTMEKDFYRGRLEQRHGLKVLVPGKKDRQTVHDVIYDELVCGQLNPSSRVAYRDIVQGLIERGAQGIIAGCTEIELLLRPVDVPVPYFPTTRLHAMAVVDFALCD
jgi:aspartate racemase